MHSADLFERIKVDAIRLNKMNEFGALHIFVADGNCELEDLVFCREQPNITVEEAAWLEHLVNNYTEEQIFAIYAFSECSDILASSHP